MNTFYDEQPNHLYKFTPSTQDVEIYREHISCLEQYRKLNVIKSKAIWGFLTAAFFCLLFYPFVFIFLIISAVIFEIIGLDELILIKNNKYKNQSLAYTYLGLNSAYDSNSEIICIFCGGNNIVYTTDSCSFNCTRCKRYLFSIEDDNPQVVGDDINERLTKLFKDIEYIGMSPTTTVRTGTLIDTMDYHRSDFMDSIDTHRPDF